MKLEGNTITLDAREAAELDAAAKTLGVSVYELLEQALVAAKLEAARKPWRELPPSEYKRRAFALLEQVLDAQGLKIADGFYPGAPWFEIRHRDERIVGCVSLCKYGAGMLVQKQGLPVECVQLLYRVVDAFDPLLCNAWFEGRA